MNIHDFLWNACLFLIITVIALPISKRLGLGSVLGYLIAGIIVGPWGLKQITNPTEILHFSEFGVVMLLFLIGLELNPARLWKMRGPILGMGGLQVIFSVFLIGFATYLLGWTWRPALVFGMGLALSSTAIALQLMAERNLMRTPVGGQAFGVLLFQDLVVIPMMAIIPLLAVSNAAVASGSEFITFAKMFGAILLVIFGGRYLLRWLLRFVTSVNMREVLTAASLLTVVGIAEIMNAVGLSMALGTFLAGVLLADSEYRHELETDIEPFKGLLLGLFFTSVGMSMDFGLFAQEGTKIVSLALGLMLIKLTVLVGIGYVFKTQSRSLPLFGLLLCQGGEFAFVLFNSAEGLGIINPKDANLFTMVVAVSMFCSPLFMLVYDRLIAPRLASFEPTSTEAHENPSNSHPILILGFGRFGQIIGRFLNSLGIQMTILDHDSNQIAMLKRFGYKVYFGDAKRRDLLESAHIKECKILVIAIDDPEAVVEIANMVKEYYPHLKVFARARNRNDVYRLMDLGVQSIHRETFGSAMHMATEVLVELGHSPYRSRRLAHTFVQHDRRILMEAYQHRHDEKAVVAIGNRARKELVSLMQEDALGREEGIDHAWDVQERPDIPPAFRAAEKSATTESQHLKM